MNAPALRLSSFYVAIFLAAGVQLPFWPVFLAGRGLEAGEIGALLAIGQWIKVAATPLAGTLADRSADRRRFMVLLAALGLVAYLSCWPARGFAALALPSALAAACTAALLPQGDALTLATAAAGRVDYGRVRLWGTAAFIVATLLGGRMLSRFGGDVVLYLLLGATALTALSCAILPVAAPKAAPASSRRLWRGLIAPRHLLFLGTATLVQASHSVYYAFGTLYWQRIGFSDAAIAWLWAEGALAEIVLFFLGGRLLRRCGPLGLIAIGGAAGLLRWSVTAFATSLLPLALSQLLHAFTFGATHLGAMHHLSRSVPAEHSGTAQAVYASVVSGLGFGLTTLAAGALYQSAGGAAYLAMAAMAAAGAALVPLVARRIKG